MDAVLFFVLTGNLISSCVLVLGNRWLLTTFEISVIALTSIQFLTLSLILNIFQRLNLFNRRSFVLKNILVLAATRCCFMLALNNFLSVSSLITHQVVKAVNFPIFFILNVFMLDKAKLSIKKCLTSALILLGASYIIVKDERLNLGFLLSGALFCALSGIHHFITSKKQVEIGANNLQLSLFVYPLSSAILLPVAILQKFTWEFDRPFSFSSGLLSLLFGLVASVECVTGHIMDKQLNHTRNVIFSELKFGMILFLGAWVFEESIDLYKMISILLIISATVAYDLINIREQTSKANSMV